MALIRAYEARDSDVHDRGAMIGAVDACGDSACRARPFLERATIQLNEDR